MPFVVLVDGHTADEADDRVVVGGEPVSFTHLTLPPTGRVWVSVVAACVHKKTAQLKHCSVTLIL